MNGRTAAKARKAPTLADLKEKMGGSYLLIDGVLSAFRDEIPNITCDCKFSKGSGWYLVFQKGQKRLFYLFPDRGDFHLKMVLNDRALGEIKKKPRPRYIREMIRVAPKYPEGTLLEFTRANFAGATIAELIRIKALS